MDKLSRRTPHPAPLLLFPELYRTSVYRRGIAHGPPCLGFQIPSPAPRVAARSNRVAEGLSWLRVWQQKVALRPQPDLHGCTLGDLVTRTLPAVSWSRGVRCPPMQRGRCRIR